eukprot:4183701-Amphidinium_carterae.1
MLYRRWPYRKTVQENYTVNVCVWCTRPPRARQQRSSNLTSWTWKSQLLTRILKGFETKDIGKVKSCEQVIPTAHAPRPLCNPPRISIFCYLRSPSTKVGAAKPTTSHTNALVDSQCNEVEYDWHIKSCATFRYSKSSRRHWNLNYSAYNKRNRKQKQQQIVLTL